MATVAEMTEIIDTLVTAAEDLRAVMYHQAAPFNCYGGRLNDAGRDLLAAVAYLRDARMDLANETKPMIGSRCGGSNPRPNRKERRERARGTK